MDNEEMNLGTYHGIDSRYTGPHPVAPTMSARYGTGFSELDTHDINSHD